MRRLLWDIKEWIRGNETLGDDAVDVFVDNFKKRIDRLLAKPKKKEVKP